MGHQSFSAGQVIRDGGKPYLGITSHPWGRGSFEDIGLGANGASPLGVRPLILSGSGASALERISDVFGKGWWYLRPRTQSHHLLLQNP